MQHVKNGCHLNSAYEKFYSTKCRHLKRRKLFNKLSFNLKKKKDEEMKPKVSRRNQITRIRGEINKIYNTENQYNQNNDVLFSLILLLVVLSLLMT